MLTCCHARSVQIEAAAEQLARAALAQKLHGDLEDLRREKEEELRRGAEEQAAREVQAAAEAAAAEARHRAYMEQSRELVSLYHAELEKQRQEARERQAAEEEEALRAAAQQAVVNKERVELRAAEYK